MPLTATDLCARLARTALVACGLLVAGGAQALTVMTCEPEWAALVRQLAPAAQVRSATHARQDPHHIEARPSLIAQVRNADLVVCTGAGLEEGWLPVLLQRAGNPRVRAGAPGLFLAADHAVLIDPRAAAGPFAGDVHAAGNPHLHLDPRRLQQVAAALGQRLAQVDPAQAETYRAQSARFQSDWSARIARWEQRAAPLRGLRVAGQHTTFAYLWRWLGVEQVVDLEPKPGVAPTPGHLQAVLGALRDAPPRAMVVAWYQDPRSAQWFTRQLAGRTPLLQLPATVADEAPADSLPALFDFLIDQLLGTAR
ncbi:MAG: hypothetical protein RL522_1423 [Pseudomonadota bacterium]|jgi:zinc/manganese transport system substrate-binding protein